MAKGLLNFAAGFGVGYLKEGQRKEERTRQDKIDERNARTAELQQRNAELGIQKLEQERDDEQSLRSAASTVEGEEGFASGEQGNQIFSEDKAQAEQLAQINADAAELEGKPAPASQAVTAATGLTGGGKPRIGAAGMNVSEMNTPEARIKRQADALRNMGRVSQATELESKFTAQQKQLYDAQRTGLFDKFVSTATTEGADAAIKLYDSYNDGFEVEHVPSGSGGVIRRMKDGKLLGEMKYSSVEDLNNQVRGLIFPDKVREEKIAAAKETVSVKPGEQVYNKDGRLVLENTNQTSADVANQRLLMGLTGGAGGGGSGTGTRSKTESLKTPEDLASSAVFDASEKADGAMKLSPEMMTTAQSSARNIARMNPSLDPYEAAQVGIALARDPAAAKPTLDAKSGRVMATVETANGSRIAVREIDPSKLDPEQRKGFAAQAQALAAQLKKDDPVVGPLVERAAFGGAAEQAQLKDTLVKMQADVLRALPAARGKSEIEINAAASRVVDGQLQKLAGTMNAIRTFGTPPPPVKGSQGSRFDAPAESGGGRPGYMPPSDSPAGRARARREEIASQTRAREEARRSQLAQEAGSAAQLAIESKDLASAAAVQDMPGFKFLPSEQQRAISSIVIGR